VAGTVLAFDFGLKNIGVATGQTITRTATELTTLAARDGKPDWQDVRDLVKEWQPVRLIVGLPLNMDETESEMSGRARTFAAQLERQTGVVTAMVDERLTSRAAGEATDNRGRRAGSSRKASDRSHARAAALIAQTWLNDLA
jgi:putative Holliday junction resolvase